MQANTEHKGRSLQNKDLSPSTFKRGSRTTLRNEDIESRFCSMEKSDEPVLISDDSSTDYGSDDDSSNNEYSDHFASLDEPFAAREPTVYAGTFFFLYIHLEEPRAG